MAFLKKNLTKLDAGMLVEGIILRNFDFLSFFCVASSSCLKVMGGQCLVGGLQDFIVSPRPLWV